MAFTALTNGYGGSATIAGKRTLLTSFSLGMETNLIRSQGNSAIWNRDNNKFNRMGFKAIKDFSGYELSLSFDVTEIELFNIMLLKCVESPHDSISVSFIDEAYGISYSFAETYIKSLSLNVNNESIAGMSVSLYVAKRDIELECGSFAASPFGEGIGLLDLDVMPYWKFSAVFEDFTTSELLGFEWSFSQNILPKFGCVASGSTLPQPPSKLIFSAPSVAFVLNYIMKGEKDVIISNYDYSHEERDLILKYGTKPFLTCEKSAIESITPNLAQPSTHQSFSINGSVFGKITRVDLT